jgi:hypothetical protein
MGQQKSHSVHSHGAYDSASCLAQDFLDKVLRTHFGEVLRCYLMVDLLRLSVLKNFDLLPSVTRVANNDNASLIELFNGLHGR